MSRPAAARTAKTTPAARRAVGGGQPLYVYAIVGAPFPTLRRAPKGVPGSSGLRLVPLSRSLAAVACEVQASHYAQPALDAGLKDIDWVSRCALAHEEMVEKTAEQSPTIPMKLFTLFSSEPRAKAALDRQTRALEKVMARIRGRIEWGVRVHLDERRAVTEARRSERPASSGTDFLRQKKMARDMVQSLLTDAQAVVNALFLDLGAKADESRRREPGPVEQSGRLILDAAYLVPHRASRRFRKCVQEAARELEPKGYRVVLTGPWPPYNFVGGTAR